MIILEEGTILEEDTLLEDAVRARDPFKPTVRSFPPLTPQLSYPFEILADGRVNELEQDSLEEIAMAVEIILRYPIGSRIEVPEFGVPDLTFRNSISEVSAILLEHVSRWEPRASLLVEGDADRWDTMVRKYVLAVRSKQGV